MELLEFDRETPCPACGIRIEVDRVCRDPHDDLSLGREGPPSPAHLHVVCPGCAWSGCMRTAAPDEPLPRRA
jgi:hypothetical protein